MPVQHLKTALQYTSRGYPVIPLKPKTKDTPLIKWKPYQTTKPTEAEVRQWWTKWPDANIALVTGRISELLVFDSDGPEAEKLIKDSGGLPVGPQSITSRGRQYFFHHPGTAIHNSVDAKLTLDVRADGGYVVVAPSIHPSGHVYEWVSGMSLFELGLPELRPWQRVYIREHCESNGNGSSNLEGWEIECLKGVSKGSRNDTATKLTGLYLQKGLRPAETFFLLMGWNMRNDPPLKEQEISTIVKSVVATHKRNHTGDKDEARIKVSIG